MKTVDMLTEIEQCLRYSGICAQKINPGEACNCGHEKALELIPRLREMLPVWRDIESAPKMGRILIETENGEVYAATWVRNFINGDPAWAVANIECPDNTIDNVIVRNAVRWMPLPPSPKGEA